eukprot:9742142-Heterocapsa_arctica.AAC.1
MIAPPAPLRAPLPRVPPLRFPGDLLLPFLGGWLGSWPPVLRRAFASFLPLTLPVPSSLSPSVR